MSTNSNGEAKPEFVPAPSPERDQFTSNPPVKK